MMSTFRMKKLVQVAEYHDEHCVRLLHLHRCWQRLLDPLSFEAVQQQRTLPGWDERITSRGGQKRLEAVLPHIS